MSKSAGQPCVQNEIWGIEAFLTKGIPWKKLLSFVAVFQILLPSLLVACFFSGLGARREGETLDAVLDHLAGSGLSRENLAVLSWSEPAKQGGGLERLWVAQGYRNIC